MDHSSATITCSAQLADALGRQHGAELCASRLLPLLCPLLTAPALGAKQFGDVMAVVQVWGNVGMDKLCASRPLPLLCTDIEFTHTLTHCFTACRPCSTASSRKPHPTGRPLMPPTATLPQ